MNTIHECLTQADMIISKEQLELKAKLRKAFREYQDASNKVKHWKNVQRDKEELIKALSARLNTVIVKDDMV